ncbi:MAG: acyltransferase, partial [Gammaproteobacteria bacterium]
MLSSYPKHPTQYRPDIDGLRAVAVLSVILFHLDETLVPGGFVGVDVFFVISGYLITLHILRDMDAGRFSLLEFYRRRVKRIAPVMLVVVAAVLLVSMVILRPEDTDNVGRTAFAALLSMANVYFWLFEDSDYFAQASTELPLLHLWSLGVE